MAASCSRADKKDEGFLPPGSSYRRKPFLSSAQGRIRMHRFTPLRAAVALGLAFQVHAAAAQTVRFDIPAQPLAPALAALASQAGLQLAFAAELAQGKSAPALQGPHEVSDALRALLAGSGLQGRVQGRTLVVERAASGAAATLPAVTVSAPAQAEAAPGPVAGYVARRSATAGKMDMAILETPVSIHVVGREQIEAQGAQRIQQALDGLRLPRGSSYLIPQIDPYFLERVEVLKGPASVTYGQAPLGGIVSLAGKRPTAERVREVNLAVGSHRRVQAGFDSGGALNGDGTLAYRLTALGRKADTSVQMTREERIAIAPSVTWRRAALQRHHPAQPLRPHPAGFLRRLARLQPVRPHPGQRRLRAEPPLRQRLAPAAEPALLAHGDGPEPGGHAAAAAGPADAGALRHLVAREHARPQPRHPHRGRGRHR
jgi:outer membrane receptor protein involved in Fe transport